MIASTLLYRDGTTGWDIQHDGISLLGEDLEDEEIVGSMMLAYVNPELLNNYKGEVPDLPWTHEQAKHLFIASGYFKISKIKAISNLLATRRDFRTLIVNSEHTSPYFSTFSIVPMQVRKVASYVRKNKPPAKGTYKIAGFTKRKVQDIVKGEYIEREEYCLDERMIEDG